jgi:hypothetical protein
MRLGQRHAAEGLGVRAEIDQLLVVVEDLHHARVLPRELTAQEAHELVGAQLVREQGVGDVVRGPVAIRGARGERRVAGPGALRHHVLELVLRERIAGRHGDPELLEELFVEVDLVGGGLDGNGPRARLAGRTRTRPERLAVGLDVLPAHPAREIGEPAGRHELGHVHVVVEDVGEPGPGRERGAQGGPHVLLLVERDGDGMARILRLEPALGLEQHGLLAVLDGPVAPPLEVDGVNDRRRQEPQSDHDGETPYRDLHRDSLLGSIFVHRSALTPRG